MKTKNPNLAFALTAVAIVSGAFTMLEYALYSWAFERGWRAARVTCPDAQQGERLRFVEQPFDEQLAICVYGKTYAAVSIKREAK